MLTIVNKMLRKESYILSDSVKKHRTILTLFYILYSIEKQGLSPDDNFYSKEIEERLGNLALNNQVVAGIACNVANTVIVKYQNDIDALSDLETKDQTS